MEAPPSSYLLFCYTDFSKHNRVHSWVDPRQPRKFCKNGFKIVNSREIVRKWLLITSKNKYNLFHPKVAIKEKRRVTSKINVTFFHKNWMLNIFLSAVFRRMQYFLRKPRKLVLTGFGEEGRIFRCLLFY